ncbi:MAG: aminopeptidase [Candidatus Aenigmarchaeota archaeon]|nr:aminopeptidase [Candidatus Aenigmarchaeota archaeon]
MKKLNRVSSKVWKEVIALKKKDRVLIITNPEKDVKAIALSLMEKALEKTNKVEFLVQPKKGTLDFAEDYVIKAMETRPSVIAIITSNRLGRDRFRTEKPLVHDGKKYTSIFEYMWRVEKSFRGFWSPEISLDTYVRTVDIDYRWLRKVCKKLKPVVSDADRIRVTSRKGTDITFSTKGREAQVDDGDFRKPGQAGNLPSGEVFVSPTIATAEGRIVFDGSLSYSKGSMVLKQPVVVEFRNGYVKRIYGGKEALVFKKEVEKGVRMPFKVFKDKKLAEEYSKNAKHLGEFGIGLNPKAKIVGNVLEDEKVMRTVHFAIGANYDEDAKALIHYDGLVIRPTVEIDGRVVMKDGKLLV